ncbi:unnamed protein product, partial [Staurois parvus]
MHAPKKKKNLSSSTHQTEHEMSPRIQSVSGGHFNKSRGREERIKQPFYTEDLPLRFHSEYNKHALLHIQTDFTVVGF